MGPSFLPPLSFLSGQQIDSMWGVVLPLFLLLSPSLSFSPLLVYYDVDYCPRPIMSVRRLGGRENSRLNSPGRLRSAPLFVVRYSRTIVFLGSSVLATRPHLLLLLPL